MMYVLVVNTSMKAVKFLFFTNKEDQRQNRAQKVTLHALELGLCFAAAELELLDDIADLLIAVHVGMFLLRGVGDHQKGRLEQPLLSLLLLSLLLRSFSPLLSFLLIHRHTPLNPPLYLLEQHNLQKYFQRESCVVCGCVVVLLVVWVGEKRRGWNLVRLAKIAEFAQLPLKFMSLPFPSLLFSHSSLSFLFFLSFSLGLHLQLIHVRNQCINDLRPGLIQISNVLFPSFFF